MKRIATQKKAAKPTSSKAKPAKSSEPTRAQRWQSAISKAELAKSDLDEALGELVDLQDEFSEWRDAMPNNLHGSSTYAKLDAICDLDFNRDEVMNNLDALMDAEDLEIPAGFGRD